VLDRGQDKRGPVENDLFKFGVIVAVGSISFGYQTDETL